MGWIDKYKEVIPKAQKGKLVSNKDFETPPEGFLYPKEWQNWWLDNRSNTVRSLAKEAGIPSEGIIEKAKNKINTLPEYKIKDSSPNAYYLREGKIGKSNLNSHAAYLGYNSLIPLSVGIHEPTHGISDVLPEELEEVNISNIVNNATRTNNPELKKYFKDKDYYYKTPWEVKARLNEFRYLYGLDPKKNYTVDDIKNIISNPPNKEFLEKSRKGSRGADDLLNMFTPEEILELHNKTVLNESDNLDEYILPKAQNGLQLNNSTNTTKQKKLDKFSYSKLPTTFQYLAKTVPKGQLNKFENFYNRLVDLYNLRSNGKMTQSEIDLKKRMATYRNYEYPQNALELLNFVTDVDAGANDPNWKPKGSQANPNPLRKALVSKYYGLPYDTTEIVPSKYQPTVKDTIGLKNYDFGNKYSEQINKLLSDNFYQSYYSQYEHPKVVSFPHPLNELKDFTLGANKDKIGRYRSYYDMWNIDPAKLKGSGVDLDVFNFPFDIYGRVYENEVPYQKRASEAYRFDIQNPKTSTLRATASSNLKKMSETAKSKNIGFDSYRFVNYPDTSNINPVLKPYAKEYVEDLLSDFEKYLQYKDTTVKKPIKKQNGGLINYATGGIIKDNNGYWNPDNWGKPVEIASNNITMRGVREPLLGISNTGDVHYMSPGNDYKFKGNKVTEIPMAQDGKSIIFAETKPDIGGSYEPNEENLPKELKPLADSLNYYNALQSTGDMTPEQLERSINISTQFYEHPFNIKSKDKTFIDEARKAKSFFEKRGTPTEVYPLYNDTALASQILNKLSPKDTLLLLGHKGNKLGGIPLEWWNEKISQKNPDCTVLGSCSSANRDMYGKSPVEYLKNVQNLYTTVGDQWWGLNPSLKRFEDAFFSVDPDKPNKTKAIKGIDYNLYNQKKQQGGQIKSNVQMKNQEVNLQQLQDFSNFGKKMKTGGWLDKFND